jgi:hypothetical protein
LQGEVQKLMDVIRPFAKVVAKSSGRVPYERLSAADWHALAKAYREL